MNLVRFTPKRHEAHDLGTTVWSASEVRLRKRDRLITQCVARWCGIVGQRSRFTEQLLVRPPPIGDRRGRTYAALLHTNTHPCVIGTMIRVDGGLNRSIP
jgi:hypothetical protein